MYDGRAVKALTEAQRRVLNAVRRRIEAGDPPPSYRDLCAEFGWSSTGTARDHLRALQQKGYVDLPRRRGGRVTLRSKKVSSPGESNGASAAGRARPGMSPYATGGGGVTFERKVAVQYLAHLLVGHSASELGDGRRVLSVGFQQAPAHPVDDLVVRAARPDELDPSLVLAVGVRRSPQLVSSDESTQKLVRAFVDAVLKAPTDGPEHRWCLIVAGPQPHAKQLAQLADLAAAQMDAPGFFDFVGTPGKFEAAIRDRLDQIEKLVQRALNEIGAAEVETVHVRQHTWRLLTGLSVLMPRLESPDETDWAAVTNSLIPMARGSNLLDAARLRDRLVTLAGEYSPKSAHVDLTVLRRDAHDALHPAARRHQRGWQALDHLHQMALKSVRNEVKENDGDRRVRLDRGAAATALAEAAASARAVVVGGESGVGKSALALGLPGTATAHADRVQTLCINLRHIHKLTIEFETTLGCPLSTLLCELSAPQRTLVIDGADAVAEGSDDAFRYLVDAAHASNVKVVAVTSVDSKQVVRDALADRFGPDVTEYSVAPLTDAEIAEIVTTFGELANLDANPRSRELLRRLVVVDLLVRGRVRGVPLSDADAMREVWSGLVRRREMSDRGSPDARESVLLELAALALDDVGAIERVDIVRRLDSAALAGLRQDGLLRVSPGDLFKNGPEFGHDEVRRYAVARLLLAGRDSASRITTAGAPRWSLAAARLTCQELLAEPDTAATPLRGRLAVLQASFDGLVNAGHGARWADVPGEAMLKLGNPGDVLRDAWPALRADDDAGLRRLVRLITQRHCPDGVVDIVAVEPIITLLLEDDAPWRSGEHAQGLLRDWLRAHVVAETSDGHPLRMLLRERLVCACSAADCRVADERRAAASASAVRTPEEVEEDRRRMERHRWLMSEVGHGGHPRLRRPEIAREITDKIVIELLALLGSDIGEEGEAILRRVTRDAPWALAPAVEEPMTGPALARYRQGLLASLTEAYYLDYHADGSGPLNDGIRRHNTRSFAVVPLAAWYRGPFMSLFQTDFRNGVAVLNRLLNHAARIRAGTLGRLAQAGPPLGHDDIGPYHTELKITRARQLYIGDEHVWRWYRGTGVGPYPCLSALQALERVCDQLIKYNVPIRNLVAILLDGCQNLAMVGLVVGLLVRHLENADRLLDPFLVEPFIWHQEFARIVHDGRMFAADSDGLVAPERRSWSLRNAAMFMVLGANEERVVELRQLGVELVTNARRYMESPHDDESTESDVGIDDSADQQLATVRAWASCLDRDSYRAHEGPDGLYIQAAPPEDVVQALQHGKEHLEGAQEAARLAVRYGIGPREGGREAIDRAELVDDVAVARKLVDNAPSSGADGSWDAPTLVAAAVLEAQFVKGTDLPIEALSFAADTVLRIGEPEAGLRRFDFEETFFQDGADRSAARVLPLLLLPGATALRVVAARGNETTTFDRASRGCRKLAGAVPSEVRLHLARGLDHVWETPCADASSCHHEMGLQIATETMRDCVLGRWEPNVQRRSPAELEEPLAQSIANAEDDSIVPSRLDAAIRALAPASMANICVSARARGLLLPLLAAQRRSLLSGEDDNMDDRGSHTLVSARALLTLAEDGDDAAIYEHVDAYADSSALLGTLLRALSAAAEETAKRAETARRIWPGLMRHMLEADVTDGAAFRDHYSGETTLAALIPNAAPGNSYLYREIGVSPIAWWCPLAWRPEIEAWLEPAAGSGECVDQLVSFLGVLAAEDQVRTELSWLAKLALADAARVARRTFLLPKWLIDTRSAAVDAGLETLWQDVVDALVVEGVGQLAPYSE